MELTTGELLWIGWGFPAVVLAYGLFMYWRFKRDADAIDREAKARKHAAE